MDTQPEVGITLEALRERLRDRRKKTHEPADVLIPEPWRFQAYRPADMTYLAVVLKIAERCNIDCSYCHVFNGEDDAWKEHPKVISLSTVESLGSFLSKGVRDLGLNSVRIVFQGGEPMLMPRQAFDQTCQILKAALAEVPAVEFVMQTNGTLVNEEWIELLNKHGVAAGISLDGYKEVNDRSRVDHRGRGTYDRVVRGLRLLQEAAARGLIDYPATLTVIDPNSDPRRLYRHLVDDLGVRCMNFLLPKNCHDNYGDIPVRRYGSWLAELFDEWTRGDDLGIDVRLFRDILDIVFGRRAGLWWGDPRNREWEFAICVASNGDLGPDDEYRAMSFWKQAAGYNVRSCELSDFLDSKVFHILNRAKRTLPTDCEPCVFSNICGGGALLNRFSASRGFDNPSILCESLKDFYSAVIAYLLRSGVGLRRLALDSVRPPAIAEPAAETATTPIDTRPIDISGAHSAAYRPTSI